MKGRYRQLVSVDQPCYIYRDKVNGLPAYVGAFGAVQFINIAFYLQ